MFNNSSLGPQNSPKISSCLGIAVKDRLPESNCGRNGSLGSGCAVTCYGLVFSKSSIIN